MNNATGYTLGFTLGYGGSWMLLCYIAYLMLMPFGYGYVSAELAGAYGIWCTVLRWDLLIQKYQEGLDLYL